MKWLEASIVVRPQQGEPAGAVVLRHAPGGFAEATGRNRRRCVLRCYQPASARGREAIQRLSRDLRAVVPGVRVTSRTVDDARWRDAWKAHARPVTIGRLTVAPTWWRGPVAQGRAVVRLDPGMAFGSGEHQTTRLCLAALERHVRSGGTVVDVGTGSGILAIAAARLGAHRVVAIDNDPVAVRVARENVRINRVGGRVSVRLAKSLGGLRLRADLVVANLTAQTLPAILPGVARCLKSGGLFVGSGFSPGGVREVARGMRAAGLQVARTAHLRGWCAVYALAPGSVWGSHDPVGKRSR